MTEVYVPQKTKKEARRKAIKATAWLHRRGDLSIVGIINRPEGWSVAVPRAVALAWHGVFDLLTE